MDRNNKLTCAQARDIDMVDYLAGLGFQPAKIRGNNYWYFSPWRDEKTPSFKINRKLNRWYDFGEGQGGNLVDFAIRHHNCTIGELLQMLGGHLSLPQPVRIPSGQHAEDGKITVLKVESLRSYSLCRYLQQRRIPMLIADALYREVTFEMYGKNYYAIGFKNDLGGYELRNSFFKGSSSPKGITTVDYGADEVSVFEGSFDYASLLTIMQNQDRKETNYLILNSLSFFERARPFMERHSRVNLYLDRNTAGQNCSRYALCLDKEKYQDKSAFYAQHEDLNDFLVHIGKSNSQGKSVNNSQRQNSQ